MHTTITKFQFYILVLFVLTLSVILNSVRCQQRSNNNFKQCCSQGKDSSSSTSCNDYSRLNDKSATCKFAFTICCSQNKRVTECEKGKRHALAGQRCDDLQSNSDCDALAVRCQNI